MTLHSEVDERVLRRQTTHQKLQNTLFILLFIVVALSLVVVYLQFSRLTSLANSNRTYAQILVECTTPPELRHPPVVIKKGEGAQDCYTRSKAATGAVVQDIRTISIAAAACGAKFPGDVNATESCVNKTLKNK